MKQNSFLSLVCLICVAGLACFMGKLLLDTAINSKHPAKISETKTSPKVVAEKEPGPSIEQMASLQIDDSTIESGKTFVRLFKCSTGKPGIPEKWVLVSYNLKSGTAIGSVLFETEKGKD